MQPINYNPGIPGFIKAHRYPGGPSLVMSQSEWMGYDWISVYWVNRLHFNAQPWKPYEFMMTDQCSRIVADKLYESLLSMGPPPDAFCDFQRVRVYDWEKDIIYPRGAIMTWTACKRFVNRVWRKFGDGAVPKLVDNQRYLDPVSLGGMIHLPPAYPSCRMKPILLHEIAHELTSDWHGPHFVSTYIDLCAEFLGMNHRSLCDTARRYGVTVGNGARLT